MQNINFQSRFAELAGLLSDECNAEFNTALEDLEREFQELRYLIARVEAGP